MQECRARMITDWCALLGGYGTNVSRCMIVSSHTSVLSSWLVIMLTDVTIATGSDTTTALFTSVPSDFCRKLHSINIPLSHLFFSYFISVSVKDVFSQMVSNPHGNCRLAHCCYISCNYVLHACVDALLLGFSDYLSDVLILCFSNFILSIFYCKQIANVSSYTIIITVIFCSKCITSNAFILSLNCLVIKSFVLKIKCCHLVFIFDTVAFIFALFEFSL